MQKPPPPVVYPWNTANGEALPEDARVLGIARVRAMPREGHSTNPRAGRQWKIAEPTDVELVNAEGAPTPPAGAAYHPTQIGRKQYRELKADPRFEVSFTPDAKLETIEEAPPGDLEGMAERVAGIVEQRLGAEISRVGERLMEKVSDIARMAEEDRSSVGGMLENLQRRIAQLEDAATKPAPSPLPPDTAAPAPDATPAEKPRKK